MTLPWHVWTLMEELSCKREFQGIDLGQVRPLHKSLIQSPRAQWNLSITEEVEQSGDLEGDFTNTNNFN